MGVDVDFIVSEAWNSTCLLGSDARHTSLQIYSYSEGEYSEKELQGDTTKILFQDNDILRIMI